MSLDKAIEHGKEKRKPYRGSKAIDGTCRNHGSCEWCVKNRKHKFRDKHPEEDSLYESLVRGLEQAINGEYREETVTKEETE